MGKVDSFIKKAEKFIGVTEKGGDNSGPEVEMFQKAVDDKAQKEAWCLAFVQHCAKETDKEIPGNPNKLVKTEHCMTLWNKAPKECKLDKPEIGSVMLWQYFKDGKATTSGHAGIVTAINADGTVDTIEGNTGPGKDVVREGDGVYRKRRAIKGSPAMQVKGWVKPWPEQAQPAKTESYLPPGPSEADIDVKLADIEKEAKNI